MAMDPTIFKDYDIRGIYPTQLNGEVARAIAYAIVRHFKPKSIAIGRDMRLSGTELYEAFVEVFTSQGVDVYDAGLIGTEVAYFIAAEKPYDLTLMLSASHNPPEYNGIKVVLRGPVAVTSESGLFAVRDQIKEGPLPAVSERGTVTPIDVFADWKKKILSLVDVSKLQPLSVVVDAGNGMAGVLISKVFEWLPPRLLPMYFEPDGSFPHHVPNPLVETNNKELIAKVLETHADLGITFDGDADRMFIIDDKGRFISGTITTAILARYFLEKYPGALILYNAICGRIVPQMVAKLGGTSKRVRVGHSYIKQYMKETGAVFAGEHSGHYYYKDYFRAESGVLSALLVMSVLGKNGRKLSDIVDELDTYSTSGEMNFVLADIPSALQYMRTGFSDAKSVDEIDGISVWYDQYWFNVRASKTEPLLRLNIEADTEEILKIKTEEIVRKIESMGGKRKE